MKKTIIASMLALLTMPLTMTGQTFNQLWKQASQAETQDLPQTQQQVLDKIIVKARSEKAYGHLLKAELSRAKALAAVAPDSLPSALRRLAQQEAAEKDPVVSAVYCAALGTIFNDNPHLGDIDGSDELLAGHDCNYWASHYRSRALQSPSALAAAKAGGWEPFVVGATDSRIFADDMLSVIGYETGQFAPLHQYYSSQPDMRRAALLTGVETLRGDRPAYREELRKSAYLQRLDSLMQQYADLQETGEAAIERFEYMESQTDATVEQQVQFINMALSKWGAWPRINRLRNALREKQAVTFEAHAEESVVTPGTEQRLSLDNLRAVSQLTLRIYSVKATGADPLEPGSDDGYKRMKSLLTPLPAYTQTRNYVGHRPYELFSDSLSLPALPVGVYMIEMETTPQSATSRMMYYVSGLRVVALPLPEGKVRYAVCNATTGAPVKGATLDLYKAGGRTSAKVATLTTDAKGEAVYKAGTSGQAALKVVVCTKDDKACPPMTAYGRFTFYNRNPQRHESQLYTDRAIYRPGQTVHVAVLNYETADGHDFHVSSPGKLTLTLRDANWKEVAHEDVTLNEFGTATASFTLPSTGLSGNFSISDGGSMQFIRVEDYKRPTFQVLMPEVNTHYEDGDTVVVRATARTWAGVPVQGAKVSYRVVRRKPYWWSFYTRLNGTGSGEEEVFAAETTTAADGTFEVEMPMTLPKSLQPEFYNFTVTADVTDQAGETHQGSLTLPLGNRKTALTIDMPEKVLAEGADKATLHLRNAAGADISTAATYRIDGGEWQHTTTNTPLALISPTTKSGEHTIEAICEQDTLLKKFVVFSLADKRPAVETDDWFYVSHTQFPSDDTPVTVQIGSSRAGVHILYSIIAGNKVVEQGATDVTNQLINRKLTYNEAYADGLLLSYAWVREGKTYRHTFTIKRPTPDKRLQLSWTTFRDRLTPGQKEEWTLSIVKPDGTPAYAELAAVLYDKSLDQIKSHDWSLAPSPTFNIASTGWMSGSWNSVRLYGYKRQPQLAVPPLLLSHFDHNVYPQHIQYMMVGYAAPMRSMRSGTVMMAAKQNAAVADFDSAEEVAADNVVLTSVSPGSTNADDAGAGGAADEEATTVQARENLQETAFFYPQLVTDSTGTIRLKFTLPESLTTWRFIGLAHSQDMMYGTLGGEAVASKEVMIQPNVPRFLREADNAVLSARVFNTGSNTVKGTARLFLLDPETEKVLFEARQPLTLDADSTTGVKFNVDCRTLGGRQLVVAKFVVSGKGFSDGEQHYLPILSNKELVTVTRPFTQNAPGTHTVDLKAMLPKSIAAQKAGSGLVIPKYTVEYTNNPAWLMIQALPAIGHPHDDCAFCQATAFYANSIGHHVISQIPNVKSVFIQWQSEQGNATTLSSQLAKNEELRDLLLSETPWVIDSENETEQRHRLADFFDENMMNHRLSNSVDNLKKLQNADGSWSWWPGMEGSWLVTVGVSEMLVRLNTMTGRQNDTAAMLSKAMKYMNSQVVESVRRMKEEEKKGHKQAFPGVATLQYLYLCTIDGRDQAASVVAAHDYLKKLLSKERKGQTIYEKALSAIVLNSTAYAQSLKENTVYKEETGRYYDTPRASYSWRDYRIPTQVAAIEALLLLTPSDRGTISEMQRWLLQEKRTQAWDTPINSVDAVYAFLQGQSTVLAPQEESVLKIDGQPLPTSQTTAGLGYIKTNIQQTAPQKFTAEKSSEGTSWGAVYAQFVQPSADVSGTSSGMSVKRELIVDNGNGSAQHLKVGQRVLVRITISADRDYDFVEVVDRRAACLEPVVQLSGYRQGYYCTPRDCTTNYYFNRLAKGKHVIETEYYVDRAGVYETGTCTAGCAYAPEFRGTSKAQTITVDN